MINVKPLLVIYCILKVNKTHHIVSHFLPVNPNSHPCLLLHISLSAWVDSLPISHYPPPPFPPLAFSVLRAWAPGDRKGGRGFCWSVPDSYALVGFPPTMIHPTITRLCHIQLDHLLFKGTFPASASEPECSIWVETGGGG